MKTKIRKMTKSTMKIRIRTPPKAVTLTRSVGKGAIQKQFSVVQSLRDGE